MSRYYYKLVFFVPTAHTAAVLGALFRAYPQHVGRIGAYECCAFTTRGTGQFRPLPAANPTIGTAGGPLGTVEEDRVEVRVRDEGDGAEIRGALGELKKVHPYEEVAYEVYRIEDF